MAEMLAALAQALSYFANPTLLIVMVLAIIAGLLIGIIPGINGLVGLALFIPFVFGQPAWLALPALVAMHAVCFTGGSITSILLNIPGETPTAITCVDGFPMAQKGQAGRAIGASLTSSAGGSVISVFFALAMVFLITPLIFAITTGDMVFIILAGLAFIGVLGEKSWVNGLISGGLGLLVSFIGFQSVTAVARFTFGSIYLYDGISLVAFGLGVFAIPEMVILATKGGTIAASGASITGMANVIEGVKDTFRNWWLWLRSSAIGYVIGVLPGIGGQSAGFIAYALAKQTSKNSKLFGTGVVEGVIAPQSAMNAEKPGALLTTFALGIPGSSSMAILLGAYLMVGIVPGPTMMREHLDLGLEVLIMVAVANIVGSLICFPFASKLAAIARVPARTLVPIVVVVTLVGAFVAQGKLEDVFVTLIFGAIGLPMALYGYSRPGFILGFVMGALFEQYFWMARGLHGNTFFLRPISLGIIFLVAAVFTYGPIMRLIRRRRGARLKADASRKVDVDAGSESKGALIFYIVIMIVTLTFFGLSMATPYLESKLLPLIIGGVTFILAAYGFWKEVSSARRRAEQKAPSGTMSDAAMAGREQSRAQTSASQPEPAEAENEVGEWHGYLMAAAWIVGLVLAIYVVGFIVAIPLYMFIYMVTHKTRWWVSAGYSVVTDLLMYLTFEVGMRVMLYQGLIFTLLGN